MNFDRHSSLSLRQVTHQVPKSVSMHGICHLSTLSIVWSLFVDAPPPPPRQVRKKSPVFKSFRCVKTGHGLGLW